MKKILVTKSSMPVFEEYVNEISELWESCWLTNQGKKVMELQRQLEDYLDVPNIELTVNGHQSLEIALQALGLKTIGGDSLKREVITTPFTFASTTQAIVRSGLKPVFCDIMLEDYTIDPLKIKALINDNTVAIMPVHVYGNICNIEKIDEIANVYGLKVIYDAAHAFGEKYKGRNIANFGDLSCFSFHATKVFHCIEGGALAFGDSSLINRINEIRDFGIGNQDEYIGEIGTNAKMNEFSAAMGLCNLRHLDQEITKRKRVVEVYSDNLKSIDGININFIQPDVQSNYAYMPILIDSSKCGFNRDELASYLAKNNVFARKYFYPLTSKFECYSGMFKVHETPIAEYVSRNILTLPLYASLELEDVEKICCIITKFVRKKRGV